MEVGKIEFGPCIESPRDSRKHDYEIRPDQPHMEHYVSSNSKYADGGKILWNEIRRNYANSAVVVPEELNENGLTEGGHPLFNQLLMKISQLHASKNSDYASDDPLSNFKECEKFGVASFLGILVRMSDKWSRIRSIIKKGSREVKDESIEDTLCDLAVYSLLAIIIRREAKSGGTQVKKEESR